MKTQAFHIRQNAWFGDNLIALTLPVDWTVHIVGNQPLPNLSDAEIRQRLRNPLGSPPLSKLAAGKSRVAILIDDISRPTPTARLLPLVLDELRDAGVPFSGVALVIAGGTHKGFLKGEIVKKINPDLPPGVTIITHDCRDSLVDLGRTSRGTPIQMNRFVCESDLNVGIGCIYPHPAAGFSGGGKILVPGAAGYETIRYLHDHMRGSEGRAGRIDNEFRSEVEEIAARVGLDFILNVTLNQDRDISAAFAGHRLDAFRRGVEYARSAYRVDSMPDADITLVDMYPFDASFQFAYDRGFWPLEISSRGSTRIILAGCASGMGSHDLYPVSNLFFARLQRRIEKFRPGDLLAIGVRLRAIRKMIIRRKMNLFVISENLQESALRKTLPNARVIRRWDTMLNQLIEKYKNKAHVTASVYCCAPLMLPGGGRII